MLIESFSGVRGIYGVDLDELIAKKYATVFSNFLSTKISQKICRDICHFKNEESAGPCIVIGRDSRKSGESLKLAIMAGAMCQIIDVGILPTAAIEQAVRYFGADGGIIITASHNGPEYNGFKFLDFDGAVLRPRDMHKIIDDFHDIKNLVSESKSVGNVATTYSYKYGEAFNSYKNLIISLLNYQELLFLKKSNLRIVVDPNGGTGIVAKKIFDELGINVAYVNMQEGVFSRIIEPTKDSLKLLVKDVISNQAMFGAGFDCDADRVEFILPDGSLVSGNHTLAIIVDFILSELKEQNSEKKGVTPMGVPTVVVNDATSYVVKSIVDRHGAIWKEVEVGEINVVDAMLDSNSPVGGEGSNGGVIVPPARCRDGILAIVYLLKAMVKKNKTLGEMLKELPEYYYIKEKIYLKEDFSVKRIALKEHYVNLGFKIIEISDETGGFKAIKDDSWVWFRESKTEDGVLRIIVDSQDEAIANALILDAKKLLD